MSSFELLCGTTEIRRQPPVVLRDTLDHDFMPDDGDRISFKAVADPHRGPELSLGVMWGLAGGRQ